MPGPIATVGVSAAAGTARSLRTTIGDAALLSLNQVAKGVADEAADFTVDRYNVDREVIGKYISLREASGRQRRATITLNVRALPIETFKPRVEMQQFDFVDSRGRKYSRLLPAIYFRHLRGGPERYLRPAFALTQRTTGSLLPGQKVLRRTGKDRGKLTRLRFFTFPKSYLNNQLLPHLNAFVGGQYAVRFRTAFRDGLGRLRRNS